ncbi:MAG: ABC transporter permease subunit [bacterium]
MSWPIFWQTLKSYWLTILFYCGGLFLYSMFLTFIYPVARDVGTNYTEIFNKIPVQIREAMGGANFLDNGLSFEGFLSLEHLKFFWVIAVCAFIIGFASRAIAGEVEQGTIALLLSQPVTRTQIFFSKLAVGVIGIVALVGATIGGILWQTYRLDIAIAPIEGYWLFTNVAILFFISILAIAMMFSTMVAERGRATLLPLLFVIVSFAIDLFAKLNEDWENLKWLSIFNYYGTPDSIITTASIDDLNLWVFGGIIVVATIAGLATFNRRDIAV